MDFATRAYNDTYRIDPIVRSLLDTDFYKLLMHQFIWSEYFNTDVSFAVTNRTTKVRLADDLNLFELRKQLDHVRTLKFEEEELIWLAGNKFYGQTDIFHSGYLDYLRHSFKLSDYDLSVVDGQLILEFHGKWAETTLWEIYALRIITVMRAKQAMGNKSRFELKRMYTEAYNRLFSKLDAIATHCPDINLTDFSTRRSHSFLWQKECVEAAVEILGKDRFTGTSNVLIAKQTGLEAKGTNAHELPMVIAALAEEGKLQFAQYKLLRQWQNFYRGALLIMLPDTFGTTQFLKNAPQWVDNWSGIRVDSKDPVLAAHEILDFWANRGVDPKTKLTLFSDGLTHFSIMDLYSRFNDEMKIGFGWGTNFGNDFPGDDMRPISLVCKAVSADDKPCVKLSDNYKKAIGPADLIEKYRSEFGIEGMENVPVYV